MGEGRTFTCPACERTWPYEAAEIVPCQKRRKCICAECASGKQNTFHGVTFDPKADQARLDTQQGRVEHAMADQKWRTLAEISAITGDPEASISARIRTCRDKWGEGAAERRRRPGIAAEAGVWEYRIKIPERVG
ncbi:MAG: hypothetical protein EP341_03205 [Sphingomonadales bacterium]|nr:MAG: hypothetical protein EP341_03205 [Sphingomonadales bacterium]